MSAPAASHPTYTGPGLVGMPSAIQTPEEIMREYEAKLAAAARAHYTNEQLIEDWLLHMEPALAKNSRKPWANRTRRVLDWLKAEDIHVLNLTRTQALRFAGWLQTAQYEGRKSAPGKLAHATVHKLIQHLSLICDYLRDVRGLIRVNPCEGISKLYFKHHKTAIQPDLRALTEQEAVWVLEGAEDLDGFLSALLTFKTAIRREECATIRTDKIDWQKRTFEAEPHPKRSFLTVYFDEETEYFLRLKVEQNAKKYPGNPYLFPSPEKEGAHVSPRTVSAWFHEMVKNSKLAKTIRDWIKGKERATYHTGRRTVTSWWKRARKTAPQGCPSHVVATLRGDSMRARSELIPDPTQGIYTKFGEIEGVDELRYWYDRCTPKLGARAIWEGLMPEAWNATSIQALIRSQRAGA